MQHSLLVNGAAGQHVVLTICVYFCILIKSISNSSVLSIIPWLPSTKDKARSPCNSTHMASSHTSPSKAISKEHVGTAKTCIVHQCPALHLRKRLLQQMPTAHVQRHMRGACGPRSSCERVSCTTHRKSAGLRPLFVVAVVRISQLNRHYDAPDATNLGCRSAKGFQVRIDTTQSVAIYIARVGKA